MKKRFKKITIVLLVIMLCLPITNNPKIENKVSASNNYSSNKIFVTIGDSITARDKQTYGAKVPHKGYQQFIQEGLGLSGYINLGISGATIARGSEYLRGITKIATDFTFGDVDFIIVYAGTNDFKLGVPIGDKSELTKDSPDRYNFYGAYAGLVKDLKRNNPGVPIYLFTPTKRDCKDFENVCKNSNGTYLLEYVKATLEVAKEFNVNVVDMYGLKEMTQENLLTYTVDGLHLNNKGYELLANKFMEVYKSKKGIKM